MLESQSFKIPAGSSFWDLYEKRFEAGNGSRIDTALHTIEEANIKLKSVFQDISFNTDKLGDEKQKNDILRHLLEDLKQTNSQLALNTISSLDVINNAYEYLIKHFAAGSGKSAGEFIPLRKCLICCRSFLHRKKVTPSATLPVALVHY